MPKISYLAMNYEDFIKAMTSDDKTSWNVITAWVNWLPAQWGFVDVSQEKET